MILIVDENEERRINLQIKLRVKGYLTNVTSYQDLWFHTKPFMTVYVNPKTSDMQLIKNSQDTISVFFCDRKSVKLPAWSINFDSLKNVYEEITNIYKEKSTYQIKDKIDVVGYACMKNGKLAVGGKDINLSKREHMIVSFFMNQPKKKFRLGDASNYVWIHDNKETNFALSISRINKKLKDQLRPKLIICKDDWCYFNPEIVSYVCQEYPEEENVDNYKGYFMITVTEEF